MPQPTDLNETTTIAIRRDVKHTKIAHEICDISFDVPETPVC